MDITEYADVIEAQLVIRYYPGQGRRFSAHFEGAEVKGDGILSSAYGDGESPDAAIENYLTKIRGKRLVFNATRKDRAEFLVPASMTWKGGA